jgi:hypothetical protein
MLPIRSQQFCGRDGIAAVLARERVVEGLGVGSFARGHTSMLHRLLGDCLPGIGDRTPGRWFGKKTETFDATMRL